MLNVKGNAVLLTFLLFTVFFSKQSLAQTKKTVSGMVKDTTDTGIPSAHIRLVSGKDTLNMSADNDGRFSFEGITFKSFDILVRGIGYKAHRGSHSFDDKQVELRLAPVILKTETTMLDEVVVKGTIKPIRVMKDTIEYNAAAYTVRENDMVEDLLKQLPGLEVDQDGKVTTLGKEMTKIRVNGKDFFTGNVTEFIRQLPADMVSHLQVIDDYGDEANFTGIKKGEPAKLLNLVTKPGRAGGKFGNIGGDAGTNKRYGLLGALNIWDGDQQIGSNANLNNVNNSGGFSRAITGGVNIRRPLSTTMSLSGRANFTQNKTENETISFVETINELGTIYSDNQNRSKQNLADKGLSLELSQRLKENFLTVSLNGNLGGNRYTSNSSSVQTGVIRQDLLTGSQNKSNNPTLNSNINWGVKFGKKKKRMLMTNFSAALNKSIVDEDILTNIGYYDKATDELVKDSVLNRLVDTRNTSNNFTARFNFSEPLTKVTDTLKRKSIDVVYALSINSTNNSLQTNVRNGFGQTEFIDSLSNAYHSLFVNQNLALNYAYGSKKIDYSLGISIQPSTLSGSYEGRDDKISQATVNMSPSANVKVVLTETHSVNLLYSGNGSAPRFEQLQPVPDTRNLQNVIIGNPDLKTTFTHALNIGYRMFGPTTGRALQIGISANMTQNQVVSNVILIPDTLSGFKQETRFENANGNYRVGSNYSISLPFAKRKYTLSLNGNAGYSHMVLLTDNVRNFNKALNFSQSLRADVQTQMVSMQASVNYSFQGNKYSLPTAMPRNIENWRVILDSKLRPLKSLAFSLNGTKVLNNGYAVGATNPLLISAGVETMFLKRKMAVLKLQVSDLLNEGNVVNRMVSNNSITDTQSNQITRFVSLSFSMRLQKFGVKKKS